MRVANVLILLTVLHCCIALCCCDLTNLKRVSSLASLASSIGKGTPGKDRVTDPLLYADDSLITTEGKSNKVSKLLRFIHSKAGDAIYKKGGSNAAIEAESHDGTDQSINGKDLDLVQDDSNTWWQGKTDDEIILAVCSDRSSRSCSLAVKRALKAKPEEKSVIASALKNKPSYVDGHKVLYHKLFESAINKAEQNGLDEKIDMGFDLVATKVPYGWAATKALNLSVKMSNKNKKT